MCKLGVPQIPTAEAEPSSPAAAAVGAAKTRAQLMQAALQLWVGFRAHLNHHVGIEERAIFPSAGAHYPIYASCSTTIYICWKWMPKWG
jgi:hypothetical protein